MNPQRISFARTLPILAFVLSYVIIAVPATLAYINLKQATRHGQDIAISAPPFRISVPHDHVFRFALTTIAAGESRTIQAINLPGHFVEFAIAKATRTPPMTWSPFHWNFFVWRAVTFPICCLPFWWLTGVGLDGILQGQRLRWWHLTPGLLLWALFLLFLVSFYCMESPLERQEGVYPIWSIWLWFALLSALPIAWVKQALARRRIKASLHARLSAELQ